MAVSAELNSAARTTGHAIRLYTSDGEHGGGPSDARCSSEHNNHGQQCSQCVQLQPVNHIRVNAHGGVGGDALAAGWSSTKHLDTKAAQV